VQYQSGDKRPTIRDVATVAGVSRGTVSRVLNGGDRVSPQAQAAVEEAIQKTGYTANHAARSLALGRSNTVAFLLTEPQHLLFEDPTFSRLMGGCTAALSEHGMLLTLVTAGTPADRVRAVEYLGGRHVEGVLLASSHTVVPITEDLLAAGVPTVVCGRFPGLEAKLSMVGADDLDGGRQMTEHLISRGATRIATITGPMDTPGGFLRLEGYQQALRGAGLPVRSEMVRHGDYTQAGGGVAMQALLAECPDLDAVFVASDLMAAGALAALRESGRRVPDDVLVGGFDDAGVAQTLEPPLTTMRQPFDRISAEMVRLLLARIEGGHNATVTIPTTLIKRAST
jgi:DNA-binding LacI/PurR family transcriptional regulator